MKKRCKTRDEISEIQRKKGRNGKVILSIFAIFLIIGVGFGIYNNFPQTDVDSDSPEVRELPPMTMKPVSLPSYAKYKKAADTYTISRQIPDILSAMPCYCSCKYQGHMSLKDCFINEDGEFIEHASMCRLCMDETYDIYGWYIDGVPVEEIRTRIDEKYGTDWGEGTDTPMIT